MDVYKKVNEVEVSGIEREKGKKAV